MTTNNTPSSIVSVVICAYTERRWDALVAAVDSVLNQNVPAHEIIVVIDHNPDMLVRATAEFPQARVVANVGVQGAGAARNTAVAIARGDLVAFLDDDAVASPSWIAEAVGSLRDPAVLGVGGTITPIWEGQRPPWFPDEFNWVVGCTYPGLPTAPAPVRNLIAANMFMRRDVFQELGGFREGFGKTGQRSGTEETELCIRASAAYPNRVWLHDPDVAVGHRVPPGRSTRRYFISRCFDEGYAKATIVNIAGPHQGLSSERRYTRVVLPRGVLQYLSGFLSGHGRGEIAKGATIIVGLASTVAGFARARARQMYAPGG